MKQGTKHTLIALITLGLTVVSGCDKYLDINPLYTQDAENFFNTPADYERALIGAYDLLQTSYLTLWIGEIASDNTIAGGESVTDTEGLHEIDDMNHDAVNEELRNVFKWNYAGINRTNYILENKDKIEFDGKTEIIAQAHFLRAWYYFELVKYFGDVPLVVDKRLGNDEVLGTTRTPAVEVYKQIEADLKYAADNLTWTAAQKGRVTRGAALSLLGKVYLYQDKFTDAANTFETVINDGPYDLFEDFTTLFRVKNENNVETVFDVEYSGAEGGSYDCFVCLEGNAAVGFHGIRQYAGPYYATGNSYNLPTKDLYDAFDTSDLRRNATLLDIKAFAAANASVKYAEGGGGHTGYYNHKYLKRSDELGLPDDDLTSPVNYRAIRFADVLLMAAEAQARKTGANESKAIQYLNRVRSRVNMPDINASGTALVEAIWNERRLELSCEGFRFFDLVRTGQAKDKINGFQENKHEVFPIPQVEIDLAGGNWKQNNGY